MRYVGVNRGGQVNTAIYYPHFYPSATWLRLAALLWDRVYTMQLEGTPPPPDDFTALNESLGGVWSIAYPFDEMATISKETSVLVETGQERWDKVLKVYVRPRRRERQTVQYGVTMDDIVRSDEMVQKFARWLDFRSERLREQMTASSDDLGILKALPRGKFSGPVEELLRSRGLLRAEGQNVDIQMPKWEVPEFEHRGVESLYKPVKPRAGSAHENYLRLEDRASEAKYKGDIQAAEQLHAMAEDVRRRNLVTVKDTAYTYYLPRDVALHYLSLCADELAQLGKRDVVTDRRQFTDTLFGSDEELRGEVAAAILEAYVPEDLATIDPAQIAECRTQLSASRLKFQAEVQTLVQTFGEVASVDTYEMVKSQLVEIANERIEQTKTTYRKAKLDVTAQALSVSLTPPALATAAASALHIGLLAPAGLSAALSLFAASKVIEWRNARSERHNSPWSYVLDVARELN
jgi:hypothetical protein